MTKYFCDKCKKEFHGSDVRYHDVGEFCEECLQAYIDAKEKFIKEFFKVK